MTNKIEMEEEIVSFKTAKLAKENGCNIKGCIMVYDTEGDLTLDIGINNEDRGYNNECYKAYTQSLLQKWLREVHNIQIIIDVIQLNLNVYEYKYESTIYSSLIEEDWENDDVFDTYELALEDALVDSLNLIKP